MTSKPRAHRTPRKTSVAAAREDMLPEVSKTTDDSEIAEALARIEKLTTTAADEKIAKQLKSDYRIIAVKEHATANYEQGGWDVMVETMTDEDIYWVIYKARSSVGAIKRMAEHLAPINSSRAEIVNA